MKLNAEKEGAYFAQRYGVTGFPTILFIDSAGKVWGAAEGFVSAKGFGGYMRKVARTHKLKSKKP